MSNVYVNNQKINIFNNKKISVPGDKSLSIRWVLLASLANGKSKAYNLLNSDDVNAAIKIIKKFGIKVNYKNEFCEIYGKGINGYKFRKTLLLNAENSGTVGRLILGLLINTKHNIKLIGDKSLSKRDFKRITDPLKKFGGNYKLKNNRNLPLVFSGTNKPKPIYYYEKLGSAQCKSAIILAGLKTKGETFIKAKKSRNHTELLCKYLKLPITVKSKKNYDYIKINQAKNIRPFNYKIPSDISSAAFFIVLTILNVNTSLTIKNVNVNPSRTGMITILKKMNADIRIINKRKYKGEIIADIFIRGSNNLKAIKCPKSLNSGAIDEFLLIFLVAAKANGISTFSSLSELDQKESPRLQWGSKILNFLGIKNIITNSSIKIFGNPNIDLKSKRIVIKNFLKDHRVFMTCVIASLSFNGNWKIYDKDSINTSFPKFLELIENLKNEKN